jgi:hypothetical protein
VNINVRHGLTNAVGIAARTAEVQTDAALMELEQGNDYEGLLG